MESIQGRAMFEVGETYSRTEDIHKIYGGQKQGGISTPANFPFIFLFTGKSGEQHGYEDGWNNEGLFIYTGEGQEGDMEFVRGNKAVRDHAELGKELFLFQSLGKSRPVRFIGEFATASWEFFEAPDTNGNNRKAIRFHLVNLNSVSDNSYSKETTSDLRELRKKAQEASKVPELSIRNATSQSYRERSQAVRNYVLARAKGLCELTGEPAPFERPDGQPYLEVHHIQRLTDEGPDHPRNVAAISPSKHREIHFGKNGTELNSRLKLIVQNKEDKI